MPEGGREGGRQEEGKGGREGDGGREGGREEEDQGGRRELSAVGRWGCGVRWEVGKQGSKRRGARRWGHGTGGRET